MSKRSADGSEWSASIPWRTQFCLPAVRFISSTDAQEAGLRNVMSIGPGSIVAGFLRP